MIKRVKFLATLLSMGLVCSGAMLTSKADMPKTERTGDTVIRLNEEKVPMTESPVDEHDVDNSKSKYFPPVIKQGTINSCTSWAITYYQASYEFNRLYDVDGSNPVNQLSPQWTYNLTNGGKNEGSYFTDALKILKDIGAVDMTKLPVDTETGYINVGDISASADMWKEANKKRISGYTRVSNGDPNRIDKTTPIESADDEDLQEMKDALKAGYILSASTPGNKWKYVEIKENNTVPSNKEYAGQKIVSRCDAPGYAGHRIAIVGYNDNIWCDVNENGQVEQGEMGAFKIVNSRGTEYGNNGYMWIAYDTLNYISSVTKNSKVDLGYENREPSLIDVVYLNVDKDRKQSQYFLEFEATTSSAKGMSVKLTAIDKSDNNFRVYTATPFKNSVEIGLGDVSFDGSTNVTSGSFAIPIDNLISTVSEDTIGNYTWTAIMGNFGDKAPVTYKNVRIVDLNNNVLFEPEEGNNTEVTLDSSEKFIKLTSVQSKKGQ